MKSSFGLGCVDTADLFVLDLQQSCSHSLSIFYSSAVPVDLSPEERSELEDIRRRKGVLLQEIQRLREELREAILEVEGLESSTEGR